MGKYFVVRKKIPEKIYKEIHRSLPIACVDIVITNGKEFLLMKRRNQPQKGTWWLPGGRVLKNELLEDAVTRFLKKEIGLTGKTDNFLGFQELFFSPGYFPNINAHTIGFVFKVKISPNSRISFDKQHSEARWFSCIDRSWHPYVKKFLREASFT